MKKTVLYSFLSFSFISCAIEDTIHSFTKTYDIFDQKSITPFGVITMAQEGENIILEVTFHKLPEGKHSFHIHKVEDPHLLIAYKATDDSAQAAHGTEKVIIADKKGNAHLKINTATDKWCIDCLNNVRLFLASSSLFSLRDVKGYIEIK